MFKDRSIWLFIGLVLLAIAAFIFFSNRDGGLFGSDQDSAAIPLDLQALIPPSWEVQAEPQVTCDFDNDGADERLLIYRYDAITLTLPLTNEQTKIAPFGGVIFDVQADTLPERPESPSPYRASNLVPYSLLPDIYSGKGQGYLGETGVDLRYSHEAPEGEPCKVTEINVFGFSGTQLPARLSVFRWVDTAAGYQGEHFAGNARVESDVKPEGGNQITRVTTYNRLLNHRSLLCTVDGYIRTNLNLVWFSPDAAQKTIDFCFGAPDDPVYPEGVVVALLRGNNPSAAPPSYLLANAIVAPELAMLWDAERAPINIVSVGNPATVEPDEARGDWCTPAQIKDVAPESLWCAREKVHVETGIVLDGVVRHAVWILISVVPNQPNAELYWRVERVDVS